MLTAAPVIGPMQAATSAVPPGAGREPPAAGDGFTYEHLAEREEVWLDFMADTGDGGDPTYAVARALAAPWLPIAGTAAGFDGSDTASLPDSDGAVPGDCSFTTCVWILSRSPAVLQLAAPARHRMRAAVCIHWRCVHRHDPTGTWYSLASTVCADEYGSVGGDSPTSSIASSRASMYGSAASLDGARVLPRGDILVIGGDLAYPNPSNETYEKRLFRCFRRRHKSNAGSRSHLRCPFD